MFRCLYSASERCAVLNRQLVELRQDLEGARRAGPSPDGPGAAIGGEIPGRSPSGTVPGTPELKEINILRIENARLNAELAASKNGAKKRFIFTDFPCVSIF